LLPNAVYRLRTGGPPIDLQCPLQGNCQSGAGSLLQNQIKNNYCAAGTPVQISVATIDNYSRT